MQLKKITPTAKEIDELDLGSLVGKSKNVIIRNKETSQHDSDDDFVEPVGRAVKGVSSMEVVSRSAVSLSSKSEAAIKKMERQIQKLEGSQKKILSEVEDLKSTVKEQRDYFDSEFMKLRDMFSAKV